MPCDFLLFSRHQLTGMKARQTVSAMSGDIDIAATTKLSLSSVGVRLIIRSKSMHCFVVDLCLQALCNQSQIQYILPGRYLTLQTSSKF